MSKEIKIKLNVEDDGSIDNNVGGLIALKKELKAVKDELAGLEEGSDAFNKAAAKAGHLNDKIKDVGETINAQTGEPIERLSGSFGLLGNKVNALDFKGATAQLGVLSKGTKDINFNSLTEGVGGFVKGLAGLGKALLANPIFLIAALIIGIGVAVYELKDKIGFLGKAFDAVGSVINTVVQAGKDFLDFIGATNFAIEDKAKKTIDNAKKEGDAVSDRYDREIKIAQAAGKNTAEMEKKKQEAILQSTDAQLKALKSIYDANGKLTEDQQKQLEGLAKAATDAHTELKVIEAKQQKEIQDEVDKKNKEAADKYKADLEKKKAEHQKYLDAKADAENAEADAYDARLKKQKEDARKLEIQSYNEARADAQKMLEDYEKDLLAQSELKALQNENDLQAQLDFLEAKKAQELANTDLTENERAVIKQNYAAQEETMVAESKKKQADNEFAIADASLSSLQSLSDLYFTLKSNQLKKGSAEELAAAKKQFQINKALSIASATISGIQGVVNALSAKSVVPEPYGTILKVASAVAVGVAAAANIAKIASTQFNPGGSGGGGGAASTGGLGGGGGEGPTAAALSVSGPGSVSTTFSKNLLNNNPASQGGTNGTQPGQNANNSPQRVYVTETDITATQKKVSTVETQAKFG